MSDYYRILKPEEIPTGVYREQRGKQYGPLRIALKGMAVGDVIAIPAKQRPSVSSIGKTLDCRFADCYVTRLGGDA